MIKAIIFDFFGVIGKSTRAMMREHFNLDKQQLEELQNIHKLLDYEYIGSKNYLKAFAKVANTTYEEAYKIYEDSRSRFEHSKELLVYITELKKRFKVALLSNVSAMATQEFIDPVRKYFDLVITSHETQLAKPEVVIYELCAKKLDVDVSECVMIDDSPMNCEGAIAAGMQAIQYKDFMQFKSELEKLLLV